MDPKKFFAELQRRNVYKAAVAYSVLGWLLVQIATQVFPFFDVPSWVVRLIVIVLLLGFPIAVCLAWVFELTPEGLKRTEEVPLAKSVTRSTGRKLDFIIIGILLAVIVVLVIPRFWSRPAAPALSPQGKSIAVLPFADLSATQDQEYFSEGLMEQIINSLGRLRDLSVVARTSARVFRNKELDIRDVGRVLGVNHILEGSVRRGLGKVRIDARLINVTNGYQLWADSYDSSERDFLLLQSEVAQKVARALQVKLQLPASDDLKEAPHYDPEAYDLYLRGNYLLNKRTADYIRKALVLFDQAVAKDPQFALAHAGIANGYILLGEYDAMSAGAAAARAWPEVTKAIELAPMLPEGYTSRALLLTDFEWDWPAAEADYRRALELNPNSAVTHHWYAFHLAERGRSAEALREIELAEKNDPLAPIIQAAKAKILAMARRYDDAIAQCRATLEVEPGFTPALSVFIRACVMQRRYAEAITAAQDFVRLRGDPGAWFELAYAYAAAGEKEKAAEIVAGTSDEAKVRSTYDMAAICAAGGDDAAALEWLTNAVDRQSLELVWLRVDPRFDHLRSDPRFAAIVSRVGPRSSKLLN